MLHYPERLVRVGRQLRVCGHVQVRVPAAGVEPVLDGCGGVRIGLLDARGECCEEGVLRERVSAECGLEPGPELDC